MNDHALLLLWALLRTGLMLSLSALVLSALLRLFRVASPAVRRTAYVAVLLQGCLLIQGPFALPLPKFVESLTRDVGWDQLAQRAPAHGSSDAKVEKRDEIPLEFAGCHWREPAIGAGPFSRRPASVFQSRTNDPSLAQRDSTAYDERFSTLALGGERISSAKRQSTGGPLASWAGANGRLPPVAPDPTLSRLAFADDTFVVATTDEPPPSSAPFPWPLALVGVWAAGMIALAGRSAWTYARFVRQLPPLQDVEPEWADEWESLQREAGIRSPAALAVAEHMGPVLCRLPRGYCLIVPARDWRVLEPPQRQLVLRHELAHLERRDVWKSLAIRVLALPHWFNPLAWRIVRQFDECAEWACDEAAGRAEPERVPDYARALLQLGRRAEPVFFATRAAGTCGLSHRIRRLLSPTNEKGARMKTAVMATLLVGISVVNLTRLQTRAGEAVASAVQVPAVAQVPAGVQVPVAAQVSEAVQVPAVAQVTVTQPTPAVARVSVSNSAPAVAQVTVAQQTPVAAQVSVVQQSPLTLQVQTAVPAMTGTLQAETIRLFVDGPKQYKVVALNARHKSQQAKVDMGYILKNMREFQTKQEVLEVDELVWQQDRARRQADMVKAAKARIAAEKDPLIKDLLEKGIAEKSAELARQIDPKRAERMKQLRHQMMAKIVADIEHYAQEHNLFVVRRVDHATSHNGIRISTSPQTIATTLQAVSPGRISTVPASTKFNLGEVFALIDSPTNADTWDQEFVYVAGRGTAEEIDISEEILNRLNTADHAK